MTTQDQGPDVSTGISASELRGSHIGRTVRCQTDMADVTGPLNSIGFDTHEWGRIGYDTPVAELVRVEVRIGHVQLSLRPDQGRFYIFEEDPR